jgi:hypothetical protein
MNWEEWFKILLSGACFLGFSIISWFIANIREEHKMIWKKLDEREDELHRLSIKLASEYVTKMEMNELRREIKHDMSEGFRGMIDQLKTILGK